MTFTQELSSWIFPGYHETAEIPCINSQAPSLEHLKFPRKDSKAVIVTFLRHCGCPFAEKTLVSLRKTAQYHPSIHCIAISHSDQAATDKWLESVGGPGSVEIVVDYERKIYGAYGLGISSFWHVLNPWSLSNALELGRREKIWNRPTESGSRWQTAGTFAIDSTGVVRYVQIAQAADENGDFPKALEALNAQ